MSRRILRAFLWLRWRAFVNSLERTGARDTLQRFAIATENLGPLIALALLVPSSVALFGLGVAAGYGAATGIWVLPMEVLRYFLLIDLALTILGPLVLSAGHSANATRLLLLPIPRTLLYVGSIAGIVADPWVLLLLPAMAGVPIGLAAGLAFVPALVAAAGGLALFVFVMGATAFVSFSIQLLLRNRRRGDLVMLVIVIVLPLIGMLPQMMVAPTHRGDRRLTVEERRAQPPPVAARVALAAAPYVPSEAYRRATMVSRTDAGRAVPPLVSLAALAAAVQALGFVVFGRLLDTPMDLGARRASRLGGLWTRVIPGLSPAASAVAFTQLRLALRTPRGRSMLVTPLLMPLVLGGMAYRNGGRIMFPGLPHTYGLALSILGCTTSVIAILPLALNQFAIDRAGFTRQRLLPLSTRDLLWGKMAGNALVAALPASVCFVLPALIFRDGMLAEWVSLPLALGATFLLMSPGAAALSAIFPKDVDLGSIGRASNAHQTAGFLGMLSFAAAGAPSVLLVLGARGVLHRPNLAPVFLAVWFAIACAGALALFVPVRRLVDSRAEALAQQF